MINSDPTGGFGFFYFRFFFYIEFAYDVVGSDEIGVREVEGWGGIAISFFLEEGG
jgi:hypothetical protein